MKLNTTIDICDESTLLRVCDIMHDASFDLDQARFDAAAGTWQALFVRMFLDDRSRIREKRHLLWTKVSFPLVTCALELAGIASLEVDDQSRIGIYTFIDCTHRDGVYRLRFAEDMEIRVRFLDSPRGALKDTELLEGQSGSFLIHGSLLDGS